MRRIFYTFLLVVSIQAAFAQDDPYIEKDLVETRDIHFRESLLFIRGVINVPNVIANSGLRSSFKGIYEGNLSFNIRVASGLSLGVGMKNSLISTQERLQDVDIKMQLYTAYFRLAYARYHNEKAYSVFGANFGYNNSFFTNVVPIHSPVLTKNYNSLVFEPEYSINFVVDEHFTIGLFISYMYLFTPFDARNIALQDYSSAATRGVNSGNGFLNFGFSFYVGMGREFKPKIQE
jgi:hypothetical protein